MGGTGGSDDLRRRACGLLACVLISRIALSLSLVRYRCRVLFPFDGAYDDHVLDRLRIFSAGVVWCFLMRIVCGEQMGTAPLSDVALSLRAAPSRAASNSVGGCRHLSRYLATSLVSPGEAVERVVFTCLRRFVWSVPSRPCRWLVPFLLIGICSGGGVSRLSRLACFALCVPYIVRRCGVVGHLRSSCRAAARFASLRYSPRPATRRAGSCFAAVVLGWLVARSCCLPCVGRGGSFSCPHGVVSFRVVLAVVVLYVDCVAWRSACHSYGILVLSVGCIYRSIGFLICLVCPLLPLSLSSVR